MKFKRKPVAAKVKSGPGAAGRLLGFLGLAACAALIFAFIWLLEYGHRFTAPESSSREVLVSIPQGAGYPQIAQILQDAGVIRDKDAFLWAVRISSKLKRPVAVKAGEQALDPSLNAWETLALLVRGNFKRYPFTVPEGWAMADIARQVELSGLGSSSDFLALCRDPELVRSLGIEAPSLEGYLFPETYSFPRGTPLRSVVKAMTDQFFKVWAKYSSQAAARGLSMNEAVTLASIVEKETGDPAERPLISAVFHNRLAKKMRLQTDPTVIYGIPDFNGNITRAHLETPHAWNTYVIQGLPPGPIASPGEAAIRAAVSPAAADYLYFVSKNDGTHHFSSTLKEHNRMVAQYQRQGRSS
ncbi:MAG: endolytic transglycosylase MltG [Deltaproteobacteria bacterium]|nr:endolytic transglycosylase MltG [Deltaproteobacteria bacterium]